MDKKTLYKYIVGDASPEEKEAVAQWIDTNKNNKEEYLASCKLYILTIWQQETSLAVSEGSPETTGLKKLLSIGRELLKIAAIFAIAFSITLLFYDTTESNSEKTVMQTIYVPAGQRAELILSDSTKVWLNAKTTLTFPSHFENNNRSVILDGEGYFDVTHDKNKPFVVKTKQYDIKVLGTEFNVRSYNQNTVFEASLLKGSIQIESADHLAKLLLEPNKKAYMEQGKLKTAPITQYDYFLWKEGLICFDDITIDELFQKLQLYFDVNIVVKNTQILKQRYTGKFRTNDGIEHILRTLQLRTKFVYENEEDKGNTIIIK